METGVGVGGGQEGSMRRGNQMILVRRLTILTLVFVNVDKKTL